MSDWDDLFAAAAGEAAGGSTEQRLTTNSVLATLPPSQADHNKKKRKKDKREGANAASAKCDNKRKSNIVVDVEHQPLLFRAFLKSRVNHVDEQAADFPHWLDVSTSLCTNRSSPLFCSGYKKTCNLLRSKSPTKMSPPSRLPSSMDECEQCSLSPLFHSSQINMTQIRGKGDQTFLQSFSSVRDIRCCCSCIYEIMDQAQIPPPTVEQQHQQKHEMGEELFSKQKHGEFKSAFEFAKTAKNKANELLNNLTPLVPNGEREILEAKFRSVSDCSCTLYSNIKRQLSKQTFSQQSQNNDNTTMRRKKSKECRKGSIDFSLGSIFDDLLSLIMKCDVAYYRLYYLQVAGYLPILKDSKSGKMIYIPHPPSYFGTNNLGWNVMGGKEYKKGMLNRIRHSLGIDDAFDSISAEKWRYILNPLGLTHDDIEPITRDHTGREKDPLSFMHENRFMEGLLVFWRSGWITSNQAYLQTVNALSVSNQTRSDCHQKFYVQHETIGPQILVDWRDSCRDLLCNLYSYATIPPSILLRVKNDLRDLDSVNNIVEMGAGTGYLAYLFDQEGFHMSAFDVAPTISKNNVMRNEYHGLTQPFFDVKKGDIKQLRSVLKNQKRGNSIALLLCYPPPLSSMAEDMLLAFKSLGGRCVIHVGEFSGLTGSSKFERLLQRDFKLVSRYDCLQWGTDCTEATIWWRDNGKKGEMNVSDLIPCSCCQKEEASKRCRLSRSIKYCSSECFYDHFTERSIHLALNNVPFCTTSGTKGYLSYDDPRHFAEADTATKP